MIASATLASAALGASGDLFEADFSGGIIYKFDPSGARTVFAMGLSGPEGLAFDANGNLFVSETGTGTIYKYAPNGTRTTFASSLNGPASLVFGGAGILYDAEFFGNVIYKFTSAGARTTFATSLNGPAVLAFDSAGNLFTADFQSGVIYKYSPSGTRSTFATGTGNPHGLAFDANGNLFVGDFEGGTILRFTPTGVRSTFATGLSGPHGLAFNQSGDLFEADYNSGNIYRFTPGGGRTTFASGLSNPANLLFQPPAPPPGRNNLLNLSTRTFVGTDTGVLIGGFILQGPDPSTIVLRAIGPSLTAAGVSGALQDPFLELRDSAGVIQSNDNWQSGPDAASIASVGLAPTDPHEAALRATLASGAYTVIVRGVGDGIGIGLVELYDLQQGNNRAANISTRGNVMSGDGVMIAGCIIGGNQRKDLIVRALGPSLRDRGVANAVGNPNLRLVNSQGLVAATDDDWSQGPDAAMIIGVGLAPESALEAAMVVSLAPGAYTAIEGAAPQDSGIGLVEIYDITPASGFAQ